MGSLDDIHRRTVQIYNRNAQAWDEQRQTILLCADHLNPGGSLLLTIGHESGEVTGTVEREEVYHSSLAPDEYKTVLNTIGFESVEIKLQDESCGFHSILLAIKKRVERKINLTYESSTLNKRMQADFGELKGDCYVLRRK